MLIRQIAQYELADGTVSEPMRVIFADKVQLERAARAHKWNLNEDFTKVNSLLTWAAAKRLGHTQLGFDEFVAQIVDLAVDRDEEVDPTRTDQPSDF